MSDPLSAAKRRLSAQYLGRQGVHGFGLRRSEEGIVVYLNPGSPEDEDSLIHEIEREAAPFRLLVVREPPPRIT